MRVYRASRAILLASILAVAAGCDLTLPFGVGCTTEARPGITLQIRTSGGGVPQPDSVRVLLREGEYVEEAEVYYWPGDSFLGAYGAMERAGRYEVSVQAPGYRTWTASRVRVSEDACHVRTVRMDVTLQPEA